MTRVNVGIRPSELCDKHLIAEHKEILRIPNNLKNRVGKPPKKFTLGTGHVLWCTDHMEYMEHRFFLIKEEILWRGFTSKKFWHGSVPDDQFDRILTNRDLEEARELLKERIKLRLPKNAKWTKSKRPDWLKE